MKQEYHEYRTSNALDWDTMLSLVRKLYRDGDYRMSLLIGCGAFFWFAHIGHVKPCMVSIIE